MKTETKRAALALTALVLSACGGGSAETADDRVLTTVSPLAAPAGFGPADLRSAYALDTSLGTGATIAIVDGFDNPKAEQDLGLYRSTFGLPACTTANGCFKKVNQTGAASPLPKADASFASEIAFTIELASAACPNCKILLVEASSDLIDDLGAAVNTAVSLGATVVSMPWAAAETGAEQALDEKYFNHPAVGLFGAAGDGGFGATYPASSKYVTAVGGTTLRKSSNARGWVETAWNSGGSGCSKTVAKPSWQTDSGCAQRTINDVAAVADPSSGLAVYDSFGGSGWGVYGGTSGAVAIVAGIYALSGQGSATPALSYTRRDAFFDVTSGSNGRCASPYLCSAGAGYDGPTGNGSPNGAALAALTASNPELVVNGGFESGTSGWAAKGSVATISSPHSGANAFQIGSAAPFAGDSVVSQSIAVPSTGTTTLSFWYQPFCTDSITFDWQRMQVRDTAGAVLATPLNVCDHSGSWTNVTADLTPYKGTTIELYFVDHDDDYAGDPTYFVIDDVSVVHR